MKIIISPAKKMREDPDSLPWRDLPYFLPRTERLLETMRQMSPAELKTLWKCNDRIAALNVERLRGVDLRQRLTPAILAYEGLQYQYMAPQVFTDREFAYIQAHLRILSGFYGVLRPFDGVVPYRLEMQSKLAVGPFRDLYDFWGGELAEDLCRGTDCVLNLASKEYSVCVSRFLRPGVRFLTCVFGEEQDGRVVEKGTLCKMARGEMVRYLAENGVQDPERIRNFDRLGYHFSPERSDETTCVFLRKDEGQKEAAGELEDRET